MNAVPRLADLARAVALLLALACAATPAGADDSGGGGSGGHGSDHDSGHDGEGRDHGRDGGRDDARDDRERSLDQDEVRAGVARGDFVALSRVLRKVAAAKPGRVVSVDLTRRSGGATVYEIVLIAAGGEYWRVLVDARSSAILRQERR
jgi:hypothetical protein